MNIENKENRYFHVTPMANVPSIMGLGLLAKIGERSEKYGEKKPAVWLFSDVGEMETALTNWLGEEFNFEGDETGKEISLAIVQIDLPESFPVMQKKDVVGVFFEVFFEAYSEKNIPAEYITAVYDEAGNKVNIAAA